MFAVGETEAQRESITCPTVHSWNASKLKFKPWLHNTHSCHSPHPVRKFGRLPTQRPSLQSWATMTHSWSWPLYNSAAPKRLAFPMRDPLMSLRQAPAHSNICHGHGHRIRGAETLPTELLSNLIHQGKLLPGSLQSQHDSPLGLKHKHSDSTATRNGWKPVCMCRHVQRERVGSFQWLLKGVSEIRARLGPMAFADFLNPHPLRGKAFMETVLQESSSQLHGFMARAARRSPPLQARICSGNHDASNTTLAFHS